MSINNAPFCLCFSWGCVTYIYISRSYFLVMGYIYFYITIVLSSYNILQWNLGIRDIQGTVKNCPEFRGGLFPQVYFYVMNKPRD